MENTEIKEEVSGNGNGNGTLAEVMAQLVKDVENAVEDIGEEIKGELTDEIAIIKDQFEKKKSKIMEKAKKNANDTTANLTNKIRETLANKIEQASTNKISEVFEQADHELEDAIKLESSPPTKVGREVSADNAPEGGNVAKSENRDEIEISSINLNDETKPKQDLNDWFTQ
jgi:BMFP domain-containing protein YqiC